MTQAMIPPEGAGTDDLMAMPTKNGGPRPFTVTELERTDAPDGATGQDWYRYVLHNGSSTITGQRQGTREHVAAYAAQFAEQLNARGFRGQSVWSPRGAKPGA